jgi:hypothetical protein
LNTIGLDGAATLSWRTPNIVTRDELVSDGWKSYPLKWLSETHEHPRYGQMRDFDVPGEVPRFPGLYAYTLDLDDLVDLVDLVEMKYVGQSEHLWMVTKGNRPDVPSGSGRGGQRYGRPKHAGDTRKWVNSRLTLSKSVGRTALIWVQYKVALADQFTRVCAEHEAINRWQSRIPELGGYGWNRQ